VKEFLSRAGRRFEVRNVEDDDTAYRDLIAMGMMTVPVTVIGSEVVRGFNVSALEKALKATGEG
jgi:glutaredoxin